MWPGLAFMLLSMEATEGQGQSECTNIRYSFMRAVNSSQLKKSGPSTERKKKKYFTNVQKIKIPQEFVNEI